MKFKSMLVVLGLVCSTAYAELPKMINVYSSAIGGTKTNSCRLVMDMYEMQYDTHVNWIIKPGAEGHIALLAASQDSNFSLVCGSPSDLVFNNAKFPGHESTYSDLTAVATLFQGPLSFYTGDKNPYADLSKFLEAKKMINVGHHSPVSKAIAEQVFKKFPGLDVNWVLYKSALDSFSQLKDGSLDIYLSSGSFEEHVKSGQLKSLGFINGDKTIMGPDLSKRFPVAASIPAFPISLIAFKSKSNIADLIEFNRRLQPIITNSEVGEKSRKMAQFPLPGTIQQSNLHYENFRKFNEKLK
jgi:tripartite-type tricarboxylate transporter receptor subunit TctC